MRCTVVRDMIAFSFACSFKEQCALYWPNNDEGLVQVGAYVMRVETEVEKESGLILREVTLTNLKVRNDTLSIPLHLLIYMYWCQ